MADRRWLAAVVDSRGMAMRSVGRMQGLHDGLRMAQDGDGLAVERRTARWRTIGGGHWWQWALTCG